MKDREFVIKNMTEHDLPAVTEGESLSHQNPWTYGNFADELSGADDKRVPKILLVARDRDDVICGHICMMIIAGEATVNNITVYPKYRRQGLGSLLLNKALELSREKGALDFTLEVRVSNRAALSLYEKHGFINEGIRKNYYENPVEDAAILWKRNFQ